MASLSKVSSRDGTEIGYWSSGEGLPLVLVHGTASLHTTWNTVTPLLAEAMSVHAIDRRGRGASGDGDRYGVEREYEDVAAVVEAESARAGKPVVLVGHSFGGLCAFGTATLIDKLDKLVLYEGWPVMGSSGPAADEIAVLLDDYLSGGDLDRLLETFLREVVQLTDEQVSYFRSLPGWWESRLGVAHTIPREFRVSVPLDRERAAAVTTPTMLLLGQVSVPELKAGYQEFASALPNVRVQVLKGQDHVAHLSDPEQFANQVLDFIH